MRYLTLARYACLLLVTCSLFTGCDRSQDETEANGLQFAFPGDIPAEHIIDSDELAAQGKNGGVSLFGYDPQKRLLIWRSDWDDQADSLELIGSNPKDPDAPAPGQAAIILGGQPVMDARGRIDSDGRQDLATAEPLTVEKQTMRRADVGILLRKLDASGGHARLNMTGTIPALSNWTRDVFWNAGVGMRIVDDLDFRIGVRGRCTFCWHLATTDPVSVKQEGRRTLVEWPGIAMIMQSSSIVKVTAVPLDDQTVLEVRTVGRPTNLKILTRIVPEEA